MNWHKKHQEQRTFGALLADWITNFVGSWWFIIFHVIWFSVWIGAQIEAFPYGLLTMIVSLEAIFLSSFIMISQNRQSERDRYQAQHDYDTNTAAKKEIEQLQSHLHSIEDKKLDKILDILQRGQSRKE